MSFNNKKVNPPWAGFSEQVTEFGMPALEGIVNGDITADADDRMLSVARRAGRVEEVVLGLAQSGADNDNPLTVEIDVKIDGVSCLGTKPKFSYTSGEDSGAVSTIASGEGIVEAILDHDAKTFAEGSIITYDIDLTRSSPDTEMSGLCVLVKLEPLF